MATASTVQRPRALVVVASVVLVVCAVPLLRALAAGEGYWLWLLLLSARRAAVTAVVASAAAVVVVGVVWWVDEHRHTTRSHGQTRWLAGVGPSTSTWAPRWTTFAGLGFVAVGFMLVFASGGQDWDETPWGAPEEVAPLISLVKLVGGVLLLAAPGTLLAGGFWWVTRHRSGVKAERAVGLPGGAERVSEHTAGPVSDAERVSDHSPAGGGGPVGWVGRVAAASAQVFASVVRTLRTWLTGPAKHPAWVVFVGAVLVAIGTVVAVVTNVVGSAGDFPGTHITSPEDGLLRCCTFVTQGTTVTVWFLGGIVLLWAGLASVAVGVSWWDAERQASRPQTPEWVAGLELPPPTPVAGIALFAPTGADAGPTTPRAAPQLPAGRQRATRPGLWVGVAGVVATVVGVLLTASLRTELIGATVYVYDEGPALLGLVFLIPVGVSLLATGAVWWSTRR
ncbi:MAG: hypothetical protein FWE61_11440 [Micrococcales bacterium]|nr:hypothetical protein [Micrococcales bacterium]